MYDENYYRKHGIIQAIMWGPTSIVIGYISLVSDSFFAVTISSTVSLITGLYALDSIVDAFKGTDHYIFSKISGIINGNNKHELNLEKRLIKKNNNSL